LIAYIVYPLLTRLQLMWQNVDYLPNALNYVYYIYVSRT